MSERSTWRRVLSLSGAFLLGGVLLFAAWAKAIDPVSFVEQIEAEGLAFVVPAAAVAYAALALEVALGALLLVGVRRRWVLLGTTLLVAFFLVLTGRTYWYELQGIQREAASCGCFGHLVERTPAEAFWGDLLLLVPPLALAWLGVGLPVVRPARRYVAVGLGTAAALLFAWRAPELPLDDLATRLSPGVAVATLCAGAEGSPERICLDALMPELETGEHLVVVSSLAEEEFLDGIDRLQEHVLAGAEPEVWVLSAATPEELHTFSWQWGPAFDVRLAPEALVRPLHRRLPRSFLVVDGEVVETWSGLPRGDDGLVL